ncbi:hypothetical protein F2Q68_00005942 [Brassica cretica]|uniref:Uncharacterized protein n=1 Tax=Brassica cretica TaxID=69181 RepID=A0A8S9JDJ4_BRACR|nr:hypothetical protein F2Q68_00005942 [Brassica cretica]
MEIDSFAAGGALKPDGDRFRRDEEPRFLIGVGDYRCKEASLTIKFQGLSFYLLIGSLKEITFFCLDDRGEEEDVGKLRQGAKLVLELGPCKDCERYQYKSFELNIVVSQACLAGVSLLCVSHNLRKHGIRKFLFVDQLSGRMGRLKFLVVTDSQFTTLFQTTAYSGRITYINGGDFAVSAVVQVVGIILCLCEEHLKEADKTGEDDRCLMGFCWTLDVHWASEETTLTLFSSRSAFHFDLTDPVLKPLLYLWLRIFSGIMTGNTYVVSTQQGWITDMFSSQVKPASLTAHLNT